MNWPGRWILLLVRFGLGSVFLYAGVAKLSDARAFTASIVMLQMVPFQWAEWIAAIVPLAELLTGAWLIADWRLRSAAFAAMLLAGVFAGATGQAMIRGLEFNCHCFGLTAQPPSAGFVLARALLLLGLAGLLRGFASPISPRINGGER